MPRGAATAARRGAAPSAPAEGLAAVDLLFLLIIVALVALTLWLVRAVGRLGGGE